MGRGELHQATAGELDPEVETPRHDAGDGEHDQDPGDDQPALRLGEQIRPRRPQPFLEAPPHGQAHQPGPGLQCRYPGQHLEQDPGHHEGREHRHQDADSERDAKATDRAGGEEEEEYCGQKSGDVGVQNGAPGPLEPCLQRSAQRRIDGVFLLCPLVDQHVGVYGHPDGEDEAGDAGEGEGGSQPYQDRVGQKPVDDQRDGCRHTHQPVEGDHVEDGQAGTDEGCLEAGVDGGLTEGRPDRSLLDHLDRDRQGTGPDEESELVGSLLVEVPRDQSLATRDPNVTLDRGGDARAGEDRLVEHDGNPSRRVSDRGTGGFGGQLGPLLLPFGQEVDRDGPETGALTVEDGRSAFDLVTTDRCRAEDQVLAGLAGYDQISISGRLGAGGH